MVAAFTCPLPAFYEGTGENPHRRCVGRVFPRFMFVVRHIRRVYIKQERCPECGLRFGYRYEMSRHRASRSSCKGWNGEPEVPQIAIDLCRALSEVCAGSIQRTRADSRSSQGWITGFPLRRWGE
ncbi:uncharacterized protein LAJ45_09850 [Morchella importuna]|uniref:uncharacterized protein n=1 Tax=Morchella importuna TaxID=1174673 RepID=UPI001E8E5D7C|nr:uncharacterized protein LAJ45_09850 [Morchella importuna]KAH8146160.1 hypothetical protein LAJ45_09850 [Morchella importuna]